MILGLTGSIASGKSSVANCFLKCGAVLVSADQLAREVVKPGSPTLAKLVDEFGMEILTAEGSLCRKSMAEKVFADPTARHQLESIIHPAISHLSECRLAELRHSHHDLIVYESPLLFEAGAQNRVDKILVVIVDPVIQVLRLQERDKLSEMEAQQRISAQWSQADKVQKADFVIDNSGTMAQTCDHVAALYRYLSRTTGFCASISWTK